MRPASSFHILGILLVFPLVTQAQSTRVTLTPQPGFTLVWDGNNGGFSSPDLGAPAPDNAALASKGVTTFASSSFQPGGVHDHINVNDGLYGNSSSWIADFAANPPDLGRFVGLSFGKSVPIASIAWSRDNGDTTEPSCGGTCRDRAVGTYTLQFTRVGNPDASTPEAADPASGWVTLGQVEYGAGADDARFSAYLRHRFDVGEAGKPIEATGLRIVVSDAGICIDEIEVNPPADPIPPISNSITITNAPGYQLSWDLNDGKFSTPSTPAPAPRNRASASAGTVAFGSSEFGAGVHFITNVIDGRYGNNHSWIPNFGTPDPKPWVGLGFGAIIELRNIAWGRDNGDASDCCGGELKDRALGVYTLQVTRVVQPGTATPETGDPSTGWASVATVHFKSESPIFQPHLRHRFDLATDSGTPIAASGIRLLVPNANSAIDELEINVYPALEQDLSQSLILTPATGFALEWDGNDGEYFSPQASARTPSHDGLASKGAQAFGSSELDYGIHFIRKINDGIYGNASSWISDRGVGAGADENPFVGIRFASPIDLAVIAFGRDNGDTTEAGCGGTCADRSLGTYTLQYTTTANPGVATEETGDAATGWVSIGTVEYLAAAPPGFFPSRRHAYSVSASGRPITASAVRIKVSDGNIAIDEIEINPSTLAVVPPISDLVMVRPATGYALTWDGNDGEFSSPATNAPARDNAALATKGSVAFGSSEVDLATHFIRNVNDGIYGNAHSWIPKFTEPADPNPFVGIRLPQLTLVRSVAFGRDNGDASDCCGGTLADRALGTYTLQITRIASPDASTPETGDPSTGWVTIGELEYRGAFPNRFTPHLRHRYGIAQNGSPVPATGLRLKVSSNQIAIDELEVNPAPIVDENVLLLAPEPGFSIQWDGNNGDFFTTNSPANAPANDALAPAGATAIGSSELGLATHFIASIQDGRYGNAYSWISDFINGDEDPWVGVAFATNVTVSSIAWGRDNGDATDCCGGQLTDRAAGTYTIQYTQVSGPTRETPDTGDPTSGWATAGRVTYRGGGTESFRLHLRHEFSIRKDGAPFAASGLRIKVSSNQIAIDELEVNPRFSIPTTLRLTQVAREGGQVVVTWSRGQLESADSLSGPWSPVAGAASPYRTTPAGIANRFFRLRD
jgi:hypothetical protein